MATGLKCQPTAKLVSETDGSLHLLSHLGYVPSNETAGLSQERQFGQACLSG